MQFSSNLKNKDKLAIVPTKKYFLVLYTEKA